LLRNYKNPIFPFNPFILVGYSNKLGLPLAIKVTAANISDNKAGILAVDLLRGKVPKLQKIAAEAGYKNAFCEHVDTGLSYKTNC
jgi:hypothetical protein